MDIKTVKYYERMLWDNRYLDRITADFINAVTAISELYGRVLFRGQADKMWEIESSAYRVLEETMSEKPTLEKLRDYHDVLLDEVKDLHDGKEYEGFTRLADLQHKGAKTCLIDYSVNPLVALWFACISKSDKDGCVYCIESIGFKSIGGKEEVNKKFNSGDTVYLFKSAKINRRIISQQSTFFQYRRDCG